MDILVDSNILISAALFPNPRMNLFWSLVTEKHNLVVCSYALEEVNRIVARKFPAKAHDMAVFFEKLQYTQVATPNIRISEKITIRDPKDYPILASAIIADVDILITGDRDFEPIEIERPEILTIRGFMEKYGTERQNQ